MDLLNRLLHWTEESVKSQVANGCPRSELVYSLFKSKSGRNMYWILGINDRCDENGVKGRRKTVNERENRKERLGSHKGEWTPLNCE